MRYLRIETRAPSQVSGPCQWIRFDAFKWRLLISLQKRDAPSGSFLGSELAPNSGNFLVRADLPHPTPYRRTEVVQQLE